LQFLLFFLLSHLSVFHFILQYLLYNEAHIVFVYLYRMMLILHIFQLFSYAVLMKSYAVHAVSVQSSCVGCYNSLPECSFSALFGRQDANGSDQVASEQQPRTDNILPTGKSWPSLQFCSV